jgi:hypothetical protein
VHHQVRAEFERTLKARAREGVVDGQERAPAMRQVRNGRDVGQSQHRIRRRLHEDELRLRRDGALGGREIRRVDEG